MAQPVPLSLSLSLTFFFSALQSEALVEKLREDDVVALPPSPVPFGAVDEDADFAAALALQQQFDRERAEFDAHRAETRHLSPFSKVVLSSDVDPSAGRILRPSRRQVYAADTADACSDDEEEDANVEDAEMEQLPAASNSPPRGGGGGSGASEVVWVTKHDAELTGRRNTSYLVETHPQHNLGDLENVRLSNPVFNTMMKHAARAESHGIRRKFGKNEQATREHVMDPRTRVILFKMVNGGLFKEINGAVSTGKESVVYHAQGEGSAEYAVKIFKTTLNEFRARGKYMEGEHRFRHQQKQNPRRVIRLWAEKEMRNLKRAEAAGIRSPRAVALKQHVLVMDFVGSDGRAAPKLQEATLDREALRSAYEQCVGMMRVLFQDCRLVHGDLSEFNMLWHRRQLWTIDLAQGVEHDHPFALRLLRDDCLHVSQFFRNRGLPTLSVRRLFEFVTCAAPPRSLELELAASAEADTPLSNPDDDVWFEAFLPQSLRDVLDPEAAQAARDNFHSDMVADGDEEEEEEDDDDDDKVPDDDDAALLAFAMKLDRLH